MDNLGAFGQPFNLDLRAIPLPGCLGGLPGFPSDTSFRSRSSIRPSMQKPASDKLEDLLFRKSGTQ
jgi:hypothetical protein